MAIREYRCSCGIVTEKLIPSDKPIPGTVECPKCSKEAVFIPFSNVSLLVSSFSNAPIDNVIGKDAERRWEDINIRQEKRDKVRREAGSAGLSMVGRNEFRALPESEKTARTELSSSISREGFKPEYESSDAKILNLEEKSN